MCDLHYLMDHLKEDELKLKVIIGKEEFITETYQNYRSGEPSISLDSDDGVDSI